MSVFIKRLRQIGILLGGGFIMIIGIILIPLPGPGLIIVLGGLMLLATEFAWARKYADGLKLRLKQATAKLKTIANPPK